MQPELGIVGYTNIDINRTPSTETTLPGGAGYFAAIAASRIIRPVGFVTRIGNDFDPTFLLTRVLPEGVHLIPDRPAAKSIQTYFSDSDKRRRDIDIQWGVNLDLCPADIPDSWLSTLQLVHVATMKPKQQSVFIHYLKHMNPHILLSFDTDIFLLKNSSTKDQIAENIRCVDLVFVNRDEYTELKPIVDRLPHAVVKLDKDGAMYLSYGKTLFYIPAIPRDAVDATGAGDIFAGTFLASRLSGAHVDESLKQAVTVATESISRIGVEHLFT